jgi:hypothetical protein
LSTKDNTVEHSNLRIKLEKLFGLDKDVLTWNSPVGLFVPWVRRFAARPIEVGITGQADVFAVVKVCITPEMVGKNVAAFVGLECKTGTGRLNPDQKRWKEKIESLGGAYFVVREIEGTKEKIEKYKSSLEKD